MNFHSQAARPEGPVVAVVDPQPAAAAVLAGLGDVGAQLVDHEPDAAGGDAGDPLAGLGVGGAVVVGAEQGADELCGLRSYADARSCGLDRQGLQPRISAAARRVAGEYGGAPTELAPAVLISSDRHPPASGRSPLRKRA